MELRGRSSNMTMNTTRLYHFIATVRSRTSLLVVEIVANLEF